MIPSRSEFGRACALVLLLGAVDVAVAAVVPGATDTFGEVVEVRVVNIEVVVTDQDGRPVTGLRREDFRLRADGRPIELTNFYAVGDAGRSDGAESAVTEVGPEVGTPSPDSGLPEDATSGLAAVILVDEASIRPESRKALFERLRQYLNQIQDDDSRFMVASMGRGLIVEVPFTRDRDQVLTGLEAIEKHASLHAAFDGQRRMFLSRLGHASLRRYQPRPGQESDLEFNDAIRVALDHAVTVRTLAEERYRRARLSYRNLGLLCEALAGLPGRKALFYLSDGLPLRPADSLVEAWTGKYQNWAIQNDDDIRFRSPFPRAPEDFLRLMSSLGSSEFDLQNELNRLMADASAAQVAFYPISARRATAGRASAEVSGSGMHGDVGAGGMHATATAVENLTLDATLLRMAEDTGGIALLGSTNLDGFVERVRRDFTHYYSLGFEPLGDSADQSLRKLTVEVGDGQFIVRHSKGYVVKNWRRNLQERTAAAAVYGLESNPLGVRLDPGEERPDGKRFVVPIMVKIPVERIRLVHEDGHFKAQVTVVALVSDSDGAPSETHRFDLPIEIPDSRVLEVLEQLAAYPINLRMTKGRKRIAVGVHDHLSGTESAVNLEIEVGRGVHL